MVIRILLVDDRPAVRRGLRMMLALEPDLAVVGEAGDGQAARSLAAALRPDVVVADVALARGDGLDLVADLCRGGGCGSTVVLSMRDGRADRARALAAGAAAFVTKCAGAGAVVEAIRSVVAGGDARRAPTAG